ncbi:hypothetical protein SAMN05660816_02475 [Niastella yeongjuensis]|nr:hypothetical protein SAMN05660816_02475 [Niastella yeongjuensis]
MRSFLRLTDSFNPILIKAKEWKKACLLCNMSVASLNEINSNGSVLLVRGLRVDSFISIRKINKGSFGN